MANNEPLTSSPKRICIDARFYRKSTAGVGRYTRGLIHALQQLDLPYDFTVILTPADYAEWPQDSQPSNWHAHVMDVAHYSMAEQTTLLNFLNAEKFDLIHFTMFNHPVQYKGPFVVTIHDLTMHLFPNRSELHPRTWAYKYVMTHAARKAKRVITPSQSTKNDVHRLLGVPNSHLEVTYEAVEPEFKPVKDEQQITRIKDTYHLTKPFLFFVNAWRPHKGLPDLLTAFSTVRKTHDIALVVAGKPNSSYADVIQAMDQAKSTTPDIIAPGFIPDGDMIPLYSAASAFVFPSHYEGFGLGALEAISCGCPTIVAKNSSLPEVLSDAALYYPTGDTNALAEAIIKLLDDTHLQRELRDKGLAQAKKFSFTQMAQETADIYKKVLHNPRQQDN